MATQATPLPGYGRDDRFFLTMAVAMALIIVAGFTLQLAMGRSSFASPPLVHLHAIVFFGFITLYVVQNVFVTRGSIAFHRRLGWIGAVWASAMVVIGITITATMVRNGTTPFFFLPAYFLVMNSLSILCFGGLLAAAILLRRRTEWHRRLVYCAVAVLTGPAFGRLLPMPLLIPYAGWAVFAAVMVWPLIGILADRRRHGAVHPAWAWGVGALIATQLATAWIPHTPLGIALYAAVTVGHPGAQIAPLEFPPPPAGPLITGR
ncbi:hypothetical protein [Sphingomonas psychrotolerans]|uniref:DUF2306 domain-containing protein n=1 Tax=Sphingomonas psychrotolerans TaxID=1327635 RepID=A0A2K8MLR4_9SPHN|nr:hypothetical protein [Sphingomonas psychrotolerans]ATY34800.1 hypothetical protein CVN68_21080 [Sphingomonas psychrotolerans]